MYISNKIREVAHFLMSARMLNAGITCLEDCIKSSMLPVVVSAVKLTAGYNDETHTFGAPSLALKLTHTIKRCAEMSRPMP